MLVEQALNSLMYNRRILPLSAVMGDKEKAKSTIKEQRGLLEKV